MIREEAGRSKTRRFSGRWNTDSSAPSASIAAETASAEDSEPIASVMAPTISGPDGLADSE